MTISPDPALGKVLLVQKPNKGNIGNAVFLMVLGVPFMLVVAATTAPMEMRIGFFVFGLCLVGFAAIMSWRNWMHVFLQESGVREYRQGRGRSLPYDQVDEMFYTTMRIFTHGSYIHTVQKLAMKSDRMPGMPLVSTLIFKEADGRSPAESSTALTAVRDRVSSILERRFLERLNRKGTVDWAPKVRIAARGLELAEDNGSLELAEWRRVRRYEMENRTLRVWLDDEPKPRLKISTAQPNFYPAYALARSLSKKAKG